MADPLLVAVDVVAGLSLIAAGVATAARRPSRTTGALLAAAGLLWFAADAVPLLLYAHRALLIHAVLHRRARPVIAAGYVIALIPWLARNDVLSVAVAVTVAAVAARRGPAVLLALAVGGPALTRLTGLVTDRSALLGYDALIAAAAVALFVTTRWGGRGPALTGLVVDLGGVRDAGTLRDRLARTLGDPTLALGFWLPEPGHYADESGRPVPLPGPGAGRTVTPLGEGAVLIHDTAAAADPRLVEDVAAAARLAAANVALHAGLRDQVAEVEASRRHLLEVADVQRRHLEAQLRAGAMRRLDRVAALVAPDDAARAAVSDARRQLQELALGLHPAVLREHGLAAALREITAGSALAVEIAITAPRPDPAVEVAAFYVCAEALANAAKHARASRVRIDGHLRDGRLRLRIDDDGAGGADPGRGTGLRGLADRVAALGGRLTVTAAPGGGTRVEADLPS